uniref:Uncharacterized protein n=1 Tax=Cannabis sativa TaxID=3483 RepID=A0A803QRM2_CANSA
SSVVPMPSSVLVAFDFLSSSFCLISSWSWMQVRVGVVESSFGFDSKLLVFELEDKFVS